MYDYFRQKFAQVTNPPIDPLRENHVMSLTTCIGREQNVFNETTGHAKRLQFDSPVLMYSDMVQLRSANDEHYSHSQVDLNYTSDETLEQALERVCDEAQRKAEEGAVMVILTDRHITQDSLPIPAAMAVGAVQQRLVNNNLRCDTNIIIETASARDPHHFAVLLGFGATAIYPYLAYESLVAMSDNKVIDKSYREVTLSYRNAINKGLFKIMSKMGISTISSYRCLCCSKRWDYPIKWSSYALMAWRVVSLVPVLRILSTTRSCAN